MRAAFIEAHGGEEVLQIGTLADPLPRAGEVRVRIRASAINHLDLWTRGGLPSLRLSFPHVLGGDGAGAIDRLGEGVSGLAVGDEVIVHPGLSCGNCERCLDAQESLCADYKILGEHLCGTQAEYVCVPWQNVFRRPDSLACFEAAAIPLVFTTAWHMLYRRARVEPGMRVLVHAAGSGVGSAAIQIARHFGAEVIATAGSDAKLARAEGLGAVHRINYATQDWGKTLRKIAPQGVDIIVDHLGAGHWPSNLRALRSGGTLVVCGATSGPKADTDLRHVFYRQLSIHGSTMGSKADFGRILELFASNRLKAVIDSRFPLDKAEAAYRRVSGREVFGKVVLEL